MRVQTNKPKRLLAAAALLAILGLTGADARAGSASYDFNTDFTGIANFFAVGSTDAQGNQLPAWQAAGGYTNSGCVKLSDGTGQTSAILFPDFDNGLVVASFDFDCLIALGDWTSGTPADGFSINYVRADDPIVALIEAGTNPGRGVAGTGQWAGSQDNGGTEIDLPEEGTQTGIGIGFDTWGTGNPPVGGSNGPNDVRGISVRVDGHQITQIAMPSVANADGSNLYATAAEYLADPTTLITGPFDDAGVRGDGALLGWAPLRVTVNENGLLNVYWKGSNIVQNFQTTYAPGPGRLLFGASTGGSEQWAGVDNINITTVGATKAILGNATGNPVGFSVTADNSGPSIIDPATIVLKLDDVVVPVSAANVDTNGIWTITSYNPASPLVSGSSHKATISAKDTRGTDLGSKDSNFTVPNYTTIAASTAATGVDKTKPGFTLRFAQADFNTDLATAVRGADVNGGTTIAFGERVLHGDFGPNTGDLTLYVGPGGTYNETNVINFNISGNAGEYLDDGTVANGVSDAAGSNLPGLPGTAARESGNDDCAMEIITYIEFPSQGAYRLDFNSDDGFRTTTAANPKEQLNSQIVSVADTGRGATPTPDWIYIGTPGIYPFRSVWVEGGGGANLEWSAYNASGVHALLNDATTAGSLKTYAVDNGTEPAAVSYVDPPRGTGRRITADMPVTFEVTDGSTAVSGIKLTLNGTDVTSSASITKSGKVTKVVYTGSPFLPLQTDTFVISFNDGASTYSGTNTFTPIPAATVIPASLALNAADVDTSKLGFLIKAYQIAAYNDNGSTNHNGPGNSTAIGEAFVHQTLGWPNLADLTAFTGPNGSFVETGFINYDDDALPTSGFLGAGNFPDDGTFGGTSPDFPGIGPNPNLPDGGVDDYAHEVLTVLDLQPGIYQMGMDSDDGVRLMVGNPKEWGTTPVVLGEFAGGRGADSWGYDGGQTARFTFQITKAGLYPFRLVYEEGGGGANLEWFSITNRNPWLPLDMGKALVGDTAAGGIKAYQYPTTSVGSTYVKSFAPGRSSWDGSQSTGRAGQDATVTAVLEDGSTPVDTTSISMTINGAAVTPTANKVAGETTVTYKPAAGFAMGSTNNVWLTFGDRTIKWSFIVGLPATPTFWIEAADFDYSGGQTKPEASVMPYKGGAYAGLGATTGVDYSGPYDTDNPYYRYPNTLHVPVSIATDYDRGGGEVTCDYRLGWEGGHWYNYTRTFPAGSYNVYAALSHGDAVSSATRIGGHLDDITGGTTNVLGAFDGPSTGGWGNNALVPMKDAATTNTVAAITLSGTRTLRFDAGNGDFDFLLFAPATTVAVQPKFTSIKANADGSITVSWTGGGTLQAAPTVKGPWQAVTGATSPYTFTPTSSMLFGRILAQ